MILRLGRHSYDENARLVMAIVNRTPDSFYAPTVCARFPKWRKPSKSLKPT